MATSNDRAVALSEAKAALGRRAHQEAVEQATRVITASPQDAVAYAIRAEALRRLGKPEPALADLAVAIRLDPDRATPYVVRAEILKKRCQFDQAIADATHALFLAPDTPAAYSIRAACREAIGDAEGAAADHEQLARLDPTRPSSRQPAPAGLPVPQGIESAADAPWDDEKHLFADGRPVDRSYRSRPIIRSADAAEVLGEDSGYGPGVLPRPLPRPRPRARPRGMGYGLAMVGVGVVVGCLLTMRGGGTPAPGREPQPRRGPAAISVATTVEGGEDAAATSGDDGRGAGPKDQVGEAGRPKAASEKPNPPTLPTDNKPRAIQLRQVRLAVGDDGDCDLTIDTTEAGLGGPELDGEPVDLKFLANAEVRRREGGTFQVVHDFGKVSSTSDFAFLNGLTPLPLQGISLDKASGLLVLTPARSDKVAKMRYPRYLKAPITMALGVEEMTGGTLILKMDMGEAAFEVEITPSEGKVAGVFNPTANTGKPQGKKVALPEHRFGPDHVSTVNFRLPVGPGKIKDRFIATLALVGEGRAAIRWLDLQANVLPSFGVAFGPTNSGMKVDSLAEDGPMARAGLKKGDVVVQVDGQKPSGVKDLIARLSEQPIGEELKVIVQRAGKEKTFTVKGE